MVVYRIGYVFPDGWENMVISCHNMKTAKQAQVEICKEYGEMPIIRREVVK
jgi:hypothetical protein